ncbi:MAG: transcriptional regulator GlxA family with amidase domain [Saprospiraceae bacterium]|jgi:transcriptional regulator GlxA family with amidase domain
MKISLFYLFISVILFTACQNKTHGENIFIPASPILVDDRYNVGILIMDGVYNTELTAPMDIFQHTIFRKGIKSMNVFLIAEHMDIVTTFEGMRILPDYSFLNGKHPGIDILVVPSAEHHLDTDLENKTLIDWVAEVGSKAEYVTSHCDGAFVLAKAGLLDNVASTTFPSDIPKYKETFSQLDVRDDVMFVHDGKYITSAGGARSFDAALYLCEHLYGKEIAQSLAGGLVIDWQLEEVKHVVLNN